MKQRIETSLIHAGVRDGYTNKKEQSMFQCTCPLPSIKKALMSLANMTTHALVTQQEMRSKKR